MNYKFNMCNESAIECKKDYMSLALLWFVFVGVMSFLIGYSNEILSSNWFITVVIICEIIVLKWIYKEFKNSNYSKYLESNIVIQDMLNNSKECCAYCGRGYYDSGCSFRCKEENNKYHLNYTEDVFTIPTHHVCDKFVYSEESTWWYYQAIGIHEKHIQKEKIKYSESREQDIIRENTSKLKEKYCN